MRFLLAPLVVALWTGCGSPDRRTGDDDQGGADACVNLECRVTNCQARGMPDTTISGTVFAPNGTLALYGVNVYIPNSDPGPLVDGVACSQCQNNLPGGSVAAALSGADGKFSLAKVPDGVNVPLVVQVGKWRRRVDIPMIVPCQDNPLPPSITSLPKNQLEGDMPRIAFTTGSNDALECLVRKLGVDAKEFTPENGTGRFNLFHANGSTTYANGTAMAEADALWGDLNRMKKYDIMAFNCEGSPHSAATPAMMTNVKTFADLGGRVFMTHYNAQWISGSPSAPQPVWQTVGSCNTDDYPETATGIIDEINNPKGAAFAAWMQSVMGSSGTGFPITSSRSSCSGVDNMKAERWVYINYQGRDVPQNFQFTTPQESPKDNRCGKVVFSDMHVSGGGSSGQFPNSCSTAPLTPQEKALAFMFFDIASCVGQIF